MLSAVFKEFEKPLSLEEVKEPSNGLILKVLATGLCHGDLHLIMGDWKYDLKIETPIILGHEIIAEVIKSWGDFKEGDKVLVYNSIGCNNCKHCKIGNYQYCERVKVLGLHLNSGFAKYLQVPTEKILLKVEGNPLELAPLADAGITAYNSVKEIGENDNVLIVGTGAVATIGLQILKTNRAKVTLVGKNWNRLWKTKELGADNIIYVRENESISSKIDPNTKFDYIIDYVGTSNSLSDLPWLLDREGELRIVGEFGGIISIPEQLMVLRGLKIRGVLYGSFNDLKSVYELYKKGKIKIPVTPYRLEDINTAIRSLMEGKIFGRAVIVP
ncbi:MAG: alcohol dehydrogenase catalytic domain-containing protein [Saccharolobus sp.]